MEIAVMPSLDRRIVAAGFVALAAISLVMARGVASDSKIYAINTTVAQGVPVPATAPTVTVAATSDVSAEIVIAGSEPDPESFDRVGLESWWAKYQKSHPAR
jgi:threonine dehydratase